jgi:hypothetical protein
MSIKHIQFNGIRSFSTTWFGCCWINRSITYGLIVGSVTDPGPYFYFDMDPDPACHFDADLDPAVFFDAVPDPDPSFQINAQNLEKVLK